MADIGIMLEGQEHLTWERFFRIAKTVEELGFESLFRSDHLTALNGEEGRESLALWHSLTALAFQTKRIRFGPLVCSMTFRHPVILAKMAASVDQLSGGRLDLGIGAGWYAGEHRMFGVPYPPFSTRLEMLDEGAQVIRGLRGDLPSSFLGNHFQLSKAQTSPKPKNPNPNLIMGGKSERTLQLVAQHATEWNCSYSSTQAYREKVVLLNAACEARGRDPSTLRHSMMVPFVIGREPRDIQAHLDGHNETFFNLPTKLDSWLSQGLIGGTPQQVVDQLSERVEAGVSRFMLQQNALDDLDSIELLANEVLPHFH